jgi:hypothetical protein
MGAEDFAGKNRSFPIKAQADVDAAFHSLGRAGSDNYSSSTIRSNIIKIAKRKGYKLPKSAQEKTSEAARGTVPGMLQLVESAGEFLAEIPLRESRTNYPIKLISPGTGTTAHYPANVLEAAAPQFKAGTLMFWNHPTAAEEASRPEGDLNNLAAITTSDARWDAAGVKGPGLYAEAKVMADYAEKVEERAPHIGLSIRAGGKGSGKMVNGKPELASIDYVESVDYVTKAGRGGLALAEAARDAGILPEEVDMTEAEIKTFVADTVKTAIREALAPQAGTVTLLERRALRGDAQVEASRILESMSLPDVAKAQVLREVIGDGSALPIKDGALDSAAFKVVVENAAKEQGRYVSSLLGGGRVAGMGASLPGVVEIDAKEAARLEKQERKALKRSLREGASIFQELGLPEAQAERAALGRVS